MALAGTPHPSNLNKAAPRPWWKEFYVWLVIAGPLLAVVACAITAFYVLQGPDALVSEDYYQEGIALGREVKTAQPPMQPAQTGRNHSATGGKTNVAP
jgi:uncharacterized protein